MPGLIDGPAIIYSGAHQWAPLSIMTEKRPPFFMYIHTVWVGGLGHHFRASRGKHGYSGCCNSKRAMIGRGSCKKTVSIMLRLRKPIMWSRREQCVQFWAPHPQHDVTRLESRRRRSVLRIRGDQVPSLRGEMWWHF